MSDTQEQYHEDNAQGGGSGFNWKWIMYGIVGVFFLSKFIFGGEKDYHEEKFQEPTGGLITHVEQIKDNEFRITDEETIAAREDSRIIASFNTGEIDTFTLEEVSMTTGESTRTSGMRAIVYGGLMGYMMGKRMSTPTNPKAYANKETHSRVQNKAGKSMASNAKTRTVRKPASSRKGYGSGKSTRSYGG